jgi:tyrosine-specific transport protein
MGKKRFFEAVATLVGCTIGAGIMGIPYVVAKAGFLTGLLDILAIGAMFLLIHLYLGEVTLRTKGKHQLPAYAEKYLGKAGKYIMFVSIIIGIYGALMAYIMGAGEAISSITGLTPLVSSIIFFIALSFIVYLGLEAIEKSEAIAFPLVLGLTALILVFALFKINPANLVSFSPMKIFLPYGVLLFAYIGTSAIPEMKEELEDNKKSLKKAIIIGSLIPIAVYVLFTLAIVGVMGSSTQEVGSVGIKAIMGENLAFIGGLFAFLTMSTSFLALSLALTELFRYDYGLRKNSSWLLACFVPFLLFLLFKLGDVASFSKVIDMTGIITGISTGVLIILIALRAKEKGERKPEYSIYMNEGIAFALIALLLVGGILKLII